MMETIEIIQAKTFTAISNLALSCKTKWSRIYSKKIYKNNAKVFAHYLHRYKNGLTFLGISKKAKLVFIEV